MRTPLASTAISPGSTSTTASYSMPLASSAVTTWTRSRQPGHPAGDLVAARHRRDHADRALHVGELLLGSLAHRVRQLPRRPAPGRTGSTPVLRTADGSGRSGMTVRITDAATAKISDELR